MFVGTSMTPYEISWNQLAIHCLTVEVVSDLKIIWYDLGMVYQVPRSQILYAINGMIVGLTRVDPSIVMNLV